MMAKVPEYYGPEVVVAIIEARTVQMETEDTAFAIEWLLEHHPMSLTSAERALEDQTFRHPALYPEGHVGLEAIRAEQRAKSRRGYQLKKLRPQIIDRDDNRCQGCNTRVSGRDATLDHKDPEGPETIENLHLLCRRCNTIKGQMTWEQFQQKQAQIKQAQDSRPDIICNQTGLSINGRSWMESGCLWHHICSDQGQCEEALDDAFDEGEE